MILRLRRPLLIERAMFEYPGLYLEKTNSERIRLEQRGESQKRMRDAEQRRDCGEVSFPAGPRDTTELSHLGTMSQSCLYPEAMAMPHVHKSPTLDYLICSTAPIHCKPPTKSRRLD